MILTSAVAFFSLLRFVLRSRQQAPAVVVLMTLAAIVVVGGMLFAKLGATSGWPVWLYYGVPAALTWILPPLALRMERRELATYVILAMALAPAVHVGFSLFLGWKEYMPFLPVPSLGEMLGSAV
jgi:hypothetical protein